MRLLCGRNGIKNAKNLKLSEKRERFAVDEVLLYRGMTWGKPTSRIPGMNGRWISDRNSHTAMKVHFFRHAVVPIHLKRHYLNKDSRMIAI